MHHQVQKPSCDKSAGHQKTHEIIFLPFFDGKVPLQSFLPTRAWCWCWTKNHTERSCHSIAIHGTSATPFSQQKENDVDNNLERNLEEITQIFSQILTKMVQRRNTPSLPSSHLEPSARSLLALVRASKFPERWLDKNNWPQKWTSWHLQVRSVDQKTTVKVIQVY